MKLHKLERRVSVFDITTPYAFTDARYSRYLEEIKKHSCIEDITVSGEFVYGKTSYAKNIRIEVDSRFLTDSEVQTIIDEIFIKVKEKHSL